MITMNNILNSPTTLSEVIDNKIKIFANDIDNLIILIQIKLMFCREHHIY